MAEVNRYEGDRLELGMYNKEECSAKYKTLVRYTIQCRGDWRQS